LPSIGYAVRFELTPNDVVPYAGEVLHTTAANENDGVLLKVMPHAGDVTRDLHAGG
jgi:hypothetical protein